MDYQIKPRFYSNTSEILGSAFQQPVDLDFTLADYCADIEKILKCSLNPKVFTRTFSAGELRIDGVCIVRILYCDQSKKSLRCCEQTVPFSTTIPVNAEISEHLILVSAKQEYVNCRALTPRRLTIHGAFTLYASMISKTVASLSEDTEDNNLQVYKKSEDVCELCEFSQELFTIAENVPLQCKNRVESIVRSELTAVVTDFSSFAGKLNIKGEITLRMLYICDAQAGECDRFVYVFPFAQSIDVDDGDWDVFDLKLDVLGYDLLLKADILSEDPSVAIDLKLCASLMGYKKKNISYICDAYSTDDNAELTFEQLTLCKGVCPKSFDTSVKAPLYLGDRTILRILDIYNESPSVKAEIKDKTLHFFGKMNVSVLGFSEEGELMCIDRQIDIDVNEALDKEYSYVKHPSATLNSLSYRMSDNNELELRADMRLSAVAGTDKTIRQVKEVCSGSGFTSPMGNNALVLYYAQKGEKIWDIAKRYATSVESICKENNLTEEELSACEMLLILKP